MRSFEVLERLWREAPAPPRRRGTVRLLTLRKGDGRYETPSRGQLSPDEGLIGDRWSRARDPAADHQVTVMEARVAAWLAGSERPLHAAGDNLLVDLDLAQDALPAGARLRVGEAILEVTPAPHTPCKKFGERFGADAVRWVGWKAHAARRLRGINCRVIAGGAVAVGDAVEVL